MRWLTLAALLAFASASLAHDRAAWIAEGKFRSPIDGQHCCGVNDCFEVQAVDIRTTATGYFLIHYNETVPYREAQPSLDGNHWRCKKPDGSRRCFFAPPGGV